MTGVLRREPGRSLRFTEVADLHLMEGLPSMVPDNAWVAEALVIVFTEEQRHRRCAAHDLAMLESRR